MSSSTDRFSSKSICAINVVVVFVKTLFVDVILGLALLASECCVDVILGLALLASECCV